MLLTQRNRTRIQAAKTRNFRTAGGTRAWIKPKPQWFDGRIDNEEDDWTDFECAYEN